MIINGWQNYQLSWGGNKENLLIVTFCICTTSMTRTLLEWWLQYYLSIEIWDSMETLPSCKVSVSNHFLSSESVQQSNFYLRYEFQPIFKSFEWKSFDIVWNILFTKLFFMQSIHKTKRTTFVRVYFCFSSLDYGKSIMRIYLFDYYRTKMEQNSNWK